MSVSQIVDGFSSFHHRDTVCLMHFHWESEGQEPSQSIDQEPIPHDDQRENIQIARIQQHFNSDLHIDIPDVEEVDEGEYDGESEAHQNESDPEIPEEIPEEDSESYDSSISAESMNVLTLYLSQQETVVTSTEAVSISIPNSIEVTPYRFRFTRIRQSEDRPQSAPPRPLNELEEMKNSFEYKYLERAAMDAKKFVYKENGKLNFESFDVYYLCGQFLENIEKLSRLLNVKPTNRE